MADNEQDKQAPGKEQAEEGAAQAKKKKKPNFSKPFIISGILLGVFAGAPFLNLGNYLFGLWGWVFGLLAAWFLSKEYKYFQIAHGGMAGFFTGLIGSGIAMSIDIGICLAGFSTFTLVPALQPALKKFAGIISFWIPGRFHSDVLTDNAVILPPWSVINEASRIAAVAGDKAISPAMKLTGHAFFMVPLLAGTAILGGIIGWKLWAKDAPKKQCAPPRRRRPAGAGKPPARKPEEAQPAQAVAPAMTEDAQTPEKPQAAPEETKGQAGNFEYKNEFPDSANDEKEAPNEAGSTGEEKKD